MSDYTYWQARLAGKPTDGLATPGYGFYRLPGRKTKTERAGISTPAKYTYGDDKPVALYPAPDGSYMVKIGTSNPTVEDPIDVWKSLFPLIASNPIEHAVYTAVMAGEPWPDRIDHPASNLPPEGFDALKIEVERLADKATEILKLPIEDEAQATLAGTLATTLGGLMKELDRLRVSEKKPHDDAADAVQQKFKPSITKADRAARDLKQHMANYLILKRERARREQEERERAEREARERLGIDEAPAPASPPPRRSSVATGGVTLTTRKVVEIYDLAKAAAFMASVDNPASEFIQVVKMIAHRCFSAGVDVPGARWETKTEAR